jgi:diacylglycerol kinase (ATP)
MRALALVGPRASQKQVQLFRQSGAELRALVSASAEDFLREITARRPELILIFGGDGTVNRHLGQLVLAGIPILVVPSGSGNDLARVAGTGTLATAILAWQKSVEGSAVIQATDLGLISTSMLAEPRYFSCCANIGMDADAARRTNTMPDWLKSRGGYFFGGLMALARYKPANMRIAAEEQHFNESAWFISISNTPTFGGGLKIAPQASVTDGLLDVTLVRSSGFSRASLAVHFPKILDGRHTGLKGLDIFTTKTLHVETPTTQDIYADGEFISQTPSEITVSPAALRLVTLPVL